jgi:hypothetical protein
MHGAEETTFASTRRATKAGASDEWAKCPEGAYTFRSPSDFQYDVVSRCVGYFARRLCSRGKEDQKDEAQVVHQRVSSQPVVRKGGPDQEVTTRGGQKPKDQRVPR